MSVTIAHRPRTHLPWRTIAVFLATAAVVLVLVSQPWETGSQSASVSAVTTASGASPGKADVPRDKSPVIRAAVFGGMPATASAEAPSPPRKSSHTPWLAGGGALSSQ